MAQARRKTLLPKENMPRAPVTQATVNPKEFGDTNAKENVKNKSSIKIPKTLRHDLENALVNLCDIWFEDIKPHLIRNNIKLHVHNAAGGEVALAPGGPGVAPSCSHQDPGAASDRLQPRNATCVSCCSRPLITSRARSRKPPPRPTTPPDNYDYIRNFSQSIPNRIEVAKNKPRKRRRKYTRKNTQSEGQIKAPKERVHRLCHNLQLNPAAQIKNCLNKKDTLNFKHINSLVMKYKMKDNFTQTDYNENVCNSLSYSVLPASKTLISPKRKITPFQRHQRARKNIEPLFQKDLVDMICSEHDKRLKVLYKSPTKSNISSIMNLLPDFEISNTRCKKRENYQPWK